MVNESTMVVPIIIVMWDLKFIVELVVTELICVGYTVNNVVRK